MEKFGGFVVEVGSGERKLLGSSVEDFVDSLAGVDEGGVVAESLDGGLYTSSLELNKSICESVLGSEDGDFVENASVTRVGIAIDKN